MARVSYVDLENPVGDVAVNEDAFRILFRGYRPINSMRAMEHTPLVTRFLMPLIAVVQRPGAGGILSGRIKALIDIKTSHLVECAYCYAHNTALGMANGITHDEVIALGEPAYMESELFSPRERAALLWAEHVTNNTAKHRDDVWDEVRKHFSEPEIVEMTMVCGLRNMRTRFQEALHIDLDPPDEVHNVGRSSKIAPNNLKKYLEHILENWPDDFPVADDDSAERADAITA